MSGRKFTKNNHGFTLIELLVAMAILAMVLVGLFMMLASILAVRNNHNVEQQINAEGNHAMNRIEFLIRNGITMPSICCPNANQACIGTFAPSQTISTINEEGRGNEAKTYWRNTISADDYNNILLHTNVVGATDDSQAVEAQLLSLPPSPDLPGIVMTSLAFECHVEDAGRLNQSAIVTVSFSLTLDLDTLGDHDIQVTEHFERSIVIANNFDYFRH